VVAHLAIHLHHHFHGPRVDFDAVALTAAASWLGITGPGEAVLIAAGIAASRGHPDIGSVVLFAWGGALTGGLGGWLLGRLGGRRVVLAGRWLRGTRERALEKGERFFERFGWLTVYFVPSWVCGINGMSAARFIPATLAWTLAWALALGLASYAIGPSIRDVATDVGFAGIAVLAVLAVAVGFLAWRRARRRRGNIGPTD
jgi:membrane protein DedA with SNARE-associated domain